jgi:hypothetical protein
MRLVLHIGLPKTGTTSIQRALATRRRALAEAGICYPASAGGGVAQMLHRVGLASDTTGRRVQENVRSFRESLTAEIRALPESIGTVVLSAEQCSLLLRDAARIGALRDFLVPLFSAVQVVLYLRRQDLHAASLYAQGLRRGQLAPPDLNAVASEYEGLYDYAALIGLWQHAFGEGNVTPRIFEPAHLMNGDVVDDFFTLFGAAACLGEVEARPRANRSMSLDGQRLILAIGRRLGEQQPKVEWRFRQWHALAAAVTEACPGQGWQPGRAQAADFLSRFAESNEAVRVRWFPQQRTLFDFDTSALPAYAADLSEEPALAASNDVIIRLLQARQED